MAARKENPTSDTASKSKGDSTEVQALEKFFSDPPKPKSANDLEAISNILEKNGYDYFSSNIRLYCIFRILGLLSMLNDVLGLLVSDFWLPLHPDKIKWIGILDSKDINRFIETQKLVLVPHLPSIDEWEQEHICCDEEFEDPFKVVRTLSSENPWIADAVEDRLTGKVVMRKTIERISPGRLNYHLEAFCLINVYHRHIEDFLGSFSTMHTISLLSTPAPYLNLHEFMISHQTTPDAISQVQGWFGCLTSAILYLHGESIYHSNIKSTTILIDRANIVITDFRQTSRTLDGRSHSFWESKVLGCAWGDDIVDIQDLGRVYAQMLSFLCGQHPGSLSIPSSPFPRWKSDEKASSDWSSFKESLRKLRTRTVPLIGQPIFDLIQGMLCWDLTVHSPAVGLASRVASIVAEKPEWCHHCCRDQLSNRKGTKASPGRLRGSFTSKGVILDQEIDLIRRELQFEGQEGWKSPRTYIILTLMERPNLRSNFLKAEVTDTWIPLDKQLLKQFIKDPSAQESFLKAQEVVLSRSMEPNKHQHFLDGEEHLHEVKQLGSGGFGSVSHCHDTKNQRDVARKLIARNRMVQGNRAKEATNMFEKELRVLRRVTSEEFHHFVSMVGSYTDPQYFAILFSPVAEKNLAEYLKSSPNKGRLRRWFGCLEVAVRTLHNMKIKHKDIKPQNCLILDDVILLTDFGISHDWSSEDSATTAGPSFLDFRYCAPEVALWDKRNESADIWSLGCVFLEMYTVLNGKTVEDIREFFATNGTGESMYHRNNAAISSWLDTLDVQSTVMKGLSKGIKDMLVVDREGRSIERLVKDLETFCEADGVESMFCDRCIEYGK